MTDFGNGVSIGADDDLARREAAHREHDGTFEILVKPATDADCGKCPDAPEGLASSPDGSGAVFVDGELIAVSDEYGTAYLAAGSDPWPTKDQVETFIQASLEFYGEAMAAALPLPQEET